MNRKDFIKKTLLAIGVGAVVPVVALKGDDNSTRDGKNFDALKFDEDGQTRRQPVRATEGVIPHLWRKGEILRKMQDDLTLYGVCAYRDVDGKIEYVNPLDPKMDDVIWKTV